MDKQSHPTFANGKICYLEIPAVSITGSAAFYHTVFNWNIRTRSDGKLAFDDAVNEVSGTWVLNTPPHTASGLLVYIMVDDIYATANAIVDNGGKMVAPIKGQHPELTASFSDLAGNIFGISQQ